MTDKKIVTPGELVTEDRKKLGQHVYIRAGKIYSDCLGIAKIEGDIATVVALHGRYTPEIGDLVLGVIVGEQFAGFQTDINHYCNAFIRRVEFGSNEQIKRGTIVSAKVMNVDEVNQVELADVRVFYGGELAYVSPVKVPRIIGKNGSMLEVLKRGTGCGIVVGRNGYVWIKGDNAELAKEAIKKIEREAHMDNLTDKMNAHLSEANKTGASA